MCYSTDSTHSKTMKNFNFLFFCKTPGYRHEQWIPADSFQEARETLAVTALSRLAFQWKTGSLFARWRPEGLSKAPRRLSKGLLRH